MVIALLILSSRCDEYDSTRDPSRVSSEEADDVIRLSECEAVDRSRIPDHLRISRLAMR
jgi:hypothetical protein